MVELVALIRIAEAQASDTLAPKMLQTGAAPPTDSSAACRRLRDSAFWRSSVSSLRA